MDGGGGGGGGARPPSLSPDDRAFLVLRGGRARASEKLFSARARSQTPLYIYAPPSAPAALDTLNLPAPRSVLATDPELRSFILEKYPAVSHKHRAHPP